MTQTATTANKSSRTVYVRASFSKARATLQERGNLFTLILSSLLLLVVAFAVYFAADLVGFIFEVLTPLPEGACSAAFYAILTLGALLAVLPMALGWLRLAVRMGKGETPLAREMLYYMQTPRVYRRSVLLGLLSAVAVGLPVALVGGIYFAASLLANEILVSTLAADVATGRLVLLYVGASVIALPALALEGFALPVLAEAVKDENLIPFAALFSGWRKGARHFGANWRFIWSAVGRAALSLCTLGVLWLLYFGPVCATAYAVFEDELK